MKLRFLEALGMNIVLANLATLRYTYHGRERLSAIEASGKRYILSLWHNQLAQCAHAMRHQPIVSMASQSKDGQLATDLMDRIGIHCTRGSSARGGAGAIIAMKKEMDAGMHAALTVDGPKGPVYEVKPGIVYLAKKTGCPIVPMMAHPSRKWTFNSWDRFELAKPFSRVDVFFGDPIFLSKSTDRELVEKDIAFVEKRMKELHEHTGAHRV